MDRIEDIWEKGNNQMTQNESFDSDTMLKSITESSIGITSRLLRSLWFGLVTILLAGVLLIINIFFYTGNLSMLFPIISLILLSAFIFRFLYVQVKVLKGMDTSELNLHDLLVFKIKYLNTRFIVALHCLSLSIVLATFTINLTMESADGIFELRKILILSSFYLFAYVLSFTLIRLTHRVYEKQLKNALLNLEENTLRSIDEELKKHKRMGRILFIVLTLVFLSGIVALLFFT